jgi:hypothetical protein
MLNKSQDDIKVIETLGFNSNSSILFQKILSTIISKIPYFERENVVNEGKS